MKSRKLTAQAAIKLLDLFFEENGEEVMGNSFGWDRAPQQLRPNEILFEFSDDVDGASTVVGFGILGMNVRDASDTEAALSCGVFKAHRRKGYWHRIMDAMVVKAKKLGADFASRTVNRDNQEHYNRSMREAFTENSKWIYAGDCWYPPPGHAYFVYPFDEDEIKDGKKEQLAHVDKC